MNFIDKGARVPYFLQSHLENIEYPLRWGRQNRQKPLVSVYCHLVAEFGSYYCLQ